jgi:RimJ/RimL family protein N-acetyltransferase
MGSPPRSIKMTILDTQIDLHTRRLHLRPPRESDADRLYALFNNWEVMRWLSSPPWPYTLDDARAFVRSRKNGDGGAMGGAITLDGELIGIADLIVKPASTVQRERGYSLGYWLGEPYWGNGLMTEAVRALLTHVLHAFRTTRSTAARSPRTPPRCASRRRLALRAMARACSFRIRTGRMCCMSTRA